MVASASFRKLHEQQAEARQKAAAEPKPEQSKAPLEQLIEARATIAGLEQELAGLRARIAELEIQLDQATTPKARAARG